MDGLRSGELQKVGMIEATLNVTGVVNGDTINLSARGGRGKTAVESQVEKEEKEEKEKEKETGKEKEKEKDKDITMHRVTTESRG